MIESVVFRQPAAGAPMVIAVFSFRHDAHLVPGLIENIRPFVNGYVSWDDRASTDVLSSEPERRNRLLAEARKLGARWILAIDPDERIEAGFATRLPRILQSGEDKVWFFHLREMFSPDSYRIDGIWDDKRMRRLFPVGAITRNLSQGLHGDWGADFGRLRQMDSETNLYHLRMATPERRRLRRALYAVADPDRKFQKIGYDYLDDERGMVLERIPPDRAFTPAFVEDHGLWSPDPGKLGELRPDPPRVRLTFAAEAQARGNGFALASHAVEDLATSHPGDPDYPGMAAMLAHLAGDARRTCDLASSLIDQAPENALALYLRGKARAEGQDASAQADLARLQALVGPCLLTRDLAAGLSRPTDDFTDPAALWRRWIPGPATCREGARITESPISVVVIGFRAPPDLARAVASLRAQDPPCEIVVVNTGGGPASQVLADHLDHIRLITTDRPLYVGAARNIGIDASRGRIVAFLASDCQALPGWIAGRLHRHDLGATSVSNPITPEPGATWLSRVSISALYSGRSPTVPPARASHYGRSFTRSALSRIGYYPTGLRATEDSIFNARADKLGRPNWAAEVLTTHREPPGFWSLIRDNFRRGALMAAFSPVRQKPGKRSSLAREWIRLGSWMGLLQKPLEDRVLYSQRMTTGAMIVVALMVTAKFLGLARGLGRQNRADALFDKAMKAGAGQSLDLLQRAVAIDPQDPAKSLALGEWLQGQNRDGAAAFRQALALDPTEARALAGLVQPLIAQGDWAAALATAETAAEIAPLTPDLWFIAAEIAAKAGRPALAVAYAQRGLCLAPEQSRLHSRMAALYQGLNMAAAAGQRLATVGQLEARPDKGNEG